MVTCLKMAGHFFFTMPRIHKKSDRVSTPSSTNMLQKIPAKDSGFEGVLIEKDAPNTAASVANAVKIGVYNGIEMPVVRSKRRKLSRKLMRCVMKKLQK